MLIILLIFKVTDLFSCDALQVARTGCEKYQSTGALAGFCEVRDDRIELPAESTDLAHFDAACWASSAPPIRRSKRHGGGGAQLASSMAKQPLVRLGEPSVASDAGQCDVH